MKETISIIIPALNEEGNIQATINNVVASVERHFGDYEIIVINDGSTDRTLEIVEETIKANNKIKVISNTTPQNIGNCYKIGCREAKMKYCVMIQGDNPFSEETLLEVFSYIGKADFICTYWKNPELRDIVRRMISSGYTGFLNFILRENMKYYNGIQIHLTKWLKQIKIRSSGFGYQAEVLVQALKQGKSYIQIPIICMERPGGGVTKVFKIKNIISVVKTICLLYMLSVTIKKPKPQSIAGN
jgi:glycosyltransferase involved in cell wall biosynthesis